MHRSASAGALLSLSSPRLERLSPRLGRASAPHSPPAPTFVRYFTSAPLAYASGRPSFAASPLAARPLHRSALISAGGGRAPRTMELLLDEDRVEALLTAIEEQERTLCAQLEKVTAAIRALNKAKPIEPLSEVEVCLDVTRSHMAHVRETKIRKKLGLVAIGGYWSLIKQLLECLERLHGRIGAWKGVVPDLPTAKLVEALGAPYHLLKQLPPILNLMPLLPTETPFAPFTSLERIHKEDVDAITTVKRWRLGFEFDRYLSDYCRKLDAVYCAVADSMEYTGVRKQISFSSSIVRYSLASTDAADRADQLRTQLTMPLLRGVWSIVEDPFLRYFAIKFGYFPDEPVLVDKDVQVALEDVAPGSAAAVPTDAGLINAPAATRPAPHVRAPSFGLTQSQSRIRSNMGSEPNLAEFLQAALAPPPPPTHLSSLKLRLMSTHPLTQNNSIFCTPPPSAAAAEGGGGPFGLLRSLSFPSFAMPDMSFWKRSPNPTPTHGGQTLGPPLNTDATVILHFHGGGWVSQTPETHIVYLRGWAQDLGVPVLSVNYSLAPEHPFPHALDQCYAAYKWILANPEKLGLSKDAPVHIYVAGDSAGGNLAAAVVVRALREKIPPPTGLLLIYPALFLGEVASLSRLLFINDPILTYATCNLCNNSYLPPELRPAAYYNPEISPGSAPPEIVAEWPRTHFLVGDIDPIIDDALYFASRLRKAGREAVIKLFYNLPVRPVSRAVLMLTLLCQHGFMNVSDQVPASVAAMREATRSLYALMEAAQRPTQRRASAEQR